MPEKDFEKQVREKMDELRLRPGEPVWDKIEKTIRKEKRRRVFFILPVFAGLLLLGYTGYRLLFHHKEIKDVATINQSSTEKNKTKALDLNNDSILHQDKQAIIKGDSIATITNPVTMQENEKSANVPAEIFAKKNQQNDKLQQVNSKPGVKNIAGKPVQKHDQSPSTPIIDRPAVESPVENNVEVVTETKPDNTTVKSEAVINPATENQRKQDEVKLTDSLIKSIDSEKTEAKSKVVSKTKAPKEGKRSWFAIQLAIGISDIRSKPLSFSKSTPDFNLSAGGVTGYPQGPSNLTIAPSEITAGKSFSIGVEWEKAISRRSAFSTGLRYAYFSNEIKVGTKTTFPLQLAYDALNNRTLDDYYGGTQTNKFTNRYHFLELPFDYHLQFNTKKKIGLEMAAGLALDWLMSSNELMYDTIRGGVYFHSDDLFNKAQLGLHTGLSLRFRLKNNAAFLIGPKAFLDLSSMTKDGFDRNRYLFAGSLQARYVFPGKTKK